MSYLIEIQIFKLRNGLVMGWSWILRITT